MDQTACSGCCWLVQTLQVRTAYAPKLFSSSLPHRSACSPSALGDRSLSNTGCPIDLRKELKRAEKLFSAERECSEDISALISEVDLIQTIHQRGGDTALMLACCYGNDSAADMLIEPTVEAGALDLQVKPIIIQDV